MFPRASCFSSLAADADASNHLGSLHCRDSRKALLMAEPDISAGSVTVFKDSQFLPQVRSTVAAVGSSSLREDIKLGFGREYGLWTGIRPPPPSIS